MYYGEDTDILVRRFPEIPRTAGSVLQQIDDIDNWSLTALRFFWKFTLVRPTPLVSIWPL
jgi:hypothetical protein